MAALFAINNQYSKKYKKKEQRLTTYAAPKTSNKLITTIKVQLSLL